MTKIKTFTKSQHDFRKEHSISVFAGSFETSCAELTQYIVDKLDEDKLVVGLSFELSMPYGYILYHRCKKH